MRKSVVAFGLAASLTAACGQETRSVPQPQAIYNGTFEHQGEWSVACYAPMRSVEAKSGDILLRLVLNNTNLVQPAALGRLNVPQEIYLEAIADINNLPSPDQIVAGESYQLPDRCQPQ